jgi:5-formyltetrahydrofolate cyclo-ligase
MDKNELRASLKQKSLDLSASERGTLSQQICNRLETIDWSDVHLLHCFEPIIKRGEVDISDFIVSLQTRYPKIQLYTSRRIDGIWRIVSWQGNAMAEELQFDAVIVPMLGFDLNLHRIGYGGGYYDKFLAKQKHARKIGVCFEVLKVRYIPVEPHDISLDNVVTEVKVYQNR